MSAPNCQCGKPTPHATICTACVHTLDVALSNLAAYHADLDTIRGRQARYGSGTASMGSVGKEVPLPIDLRFTDAVGRGSEIEWSVKATLVAWCRIVMDDWPEVTDHALGPWCATCEHPSCTDHARSLVVAQYRRHPADTVTSMCRYLQRMRKAIAVEVYAAELLDEILDTERRLRNLIDRPADRWYAGICAFELEAERTHDVSSCACACHHGNACDIEGGCNPEVTSIASVRCQRELWADPDSPVVRCGDCGTTWPVDERRDILLDEARDHQATIEAIVRLATTVGQYKGSSAKLSARIRQWATPKRAKIKPHGQRVVDGIARPLYRIGDVLDLIDAEEPRTRKAG